MYWFSHAEGSSLQDISRISSLARDTVASIVRAAALKVQMGHNADIQAVGTDTISIDFALISTFPFIERLPVRQ